MQRACECAPLSPALALGQMHPHCCNGCPEQQKPYCRCVYERRRARHAQELSEIELRLGELRQKQTDQVMLRRAIVSIATASISHSWKQMQHLQPYA